MYWSRTGNSSMDAALVVFLAASACGGWFLVRAGFGLPAKGRAILGSALGISLTTWLANLFAHLLQPPLSFWLAAGIVLVSGVVMLWRSRRGWAGLAEDFQPWLLWAAVLGMALVFFRIGRGLAIFDDRKNLSLISLMAAGEIPPHFYMNPGFFFSYHYGFQLFGAMLMRIGGLFPWSAFDLAKGLVGSLAVGVCIVWGRNATGRWGWGVALGTLVLLASGTRWLLLFLPAHVVSDAASGLQLWGSGAQTARDLAHALTQPWVIDGGPPYPLPFAFVNGILQPFILYLQSGPVSFAIIAPVLLLTLGAVSARDWTAFPSAALLAFWALASEAGFVLFVMGGVLACVLLASRPSARAPRRRLFLFAGTLAAAVVLAVLQGGTLTEAVRGLVGSSASSAEAAGIAGFTVRQVPAIVSAHLGELRLTHPGEVGIALFEIGPTILLAPLGVWVLAHAFRRGRIVLLAFAASTFIGFLLPIFLRYQGDRDITRLTQYALLGWLMLGVVPLRSIWRGGKSPVRWALALTAGVLVFGGLMSAGSLMTSLPKAVFSGAISSADASMAREAWDLLPPHALVIDSNSWRSVVITGRLTRSAKDSATLLDSWQSLVEDGEVEKMVASGFDFAYVDPKWLQEMSPEGRESFRQACVREIASVHGSKPEDDRWLYDLRGCAPE